MAVISRVKKESSDQRRPASAVVSKVKRDPSHQRRLIFAGILAILVSAIHVSLVRGSGSVDDDDDSLLSLDHPRRQRHRVMCGLQERMARLLRSTHPSKML
jgi:hypothetical protein